MRNKLWPVALLVVLGMLLTGFAPMPQTGTTTAAPAAEEAEKVELTVLIPQGSAKVLKELAPRLDTLDGKKVALWLSATEDELYAGKGAEYFDKLGELLKAKFPKIEIISYDTMPRKYSPADEVMKGITDQNPDAVVIALGG
jgi:hypothetical protein